MFPVKNRSEQYIPIRLETTGTKGHQFTDDSDTVPCRALIPDTYRGFPFDLCFGLIVMCLIGYLSSYSDQNCIPT